MAAPSKLVCFIDFLYSKNLEILLNYETNKVLDQLFVSECI
jgi:hypothetical protein